MVRWALRELASNCLWAWRCPYLWPIFGDIGVARRVGIFPICRHGDALKQQQPKYADALPSCHFERQNEALEVARRMNAGVIWEQIGRDIVQLLRLYDL